MIHFIIMNERNHLNKLAKKIAQLSHNNKEISLDFEDEKDFMIRERKRIKYRHKSIKKKCFTYNEWKKTRKLKINTNLINKVYKNASTQTYIKKKITTGTQSPPQIQKIEDIQIEFIEDEKENYNDSYCLQQ